MADHPKDAEYRNDVMRPSDFWGFGKARWIVELGKVQELWRLESKICLYGGFIVNASRFKR